MHAYSFIQNAATALRWNHPIGMNHILITKYRGLTFDIDSYDDAAVVKTIQVIMKKKQAEITIRIVALLLRFASLIESQFQQ